MSSVKKTQRLAVIGVLTAMSLVLFLFEVPVVPGVEHLKIDFGDIPALIGALLFGPWTGVVIEFLKNVIECLIKGIGTQMGFGNLMNFIVGCAYIVPFSLLFKQLTEKSKAFSGKKYFAVTLAGVLAVATIVIVGIGANYVIAPLFFKFFLGIEVTGDALWAAVWGATALNAVKGVMLTVAAYPIVMFVTGKASSFLKRG